MNDKLQKLILIILVLIFAGTTTYFVVPVIQESKKTDEDYQELYQDEISRVKYFISDWYDEIVLIETDFKAYKNELRFNYAQYTLTVAADKIRAVYPRGERFFKLQYVTYIEFEEEGGKLYCHMTYGKSGDYKFILRNN